MEDTKLKKTKRDFPCVFPLMRRRAMALPLSLVMLLVAGMLVGLALYIVENMTAVIGMKSDDELRMNAALAGIEEGKRWISDSIESGFIPRREKYGQLVTSADMVGAESTNPPFEFLVARDRNNDKGVRPGAVEGVAFESVIYDLTYDVATGVTFAAEMPLNMKIPPNFEDLEGGSLIQTQSYASSNRGLGSGGVFDSTGEYGFYVIRSKSRLNGIEKVIEQGVRMRE